MSLTFIIDNLHVLNFLLWTFGAGLVIAMIATVIGICIDLKEENKKLNDYDNY